MLSRYASGMAKKIPAAIRRYMSELGKLGGKAGAKNRTPEERSEKARKAAAARWKKVKRPTASRRTGDRT